MADKILLPSVPNTPKYTSKSISVYHSSNQLRQLTEKLQTVALNENILLPSYPSTPMIKRPKEMKIYGGVLDGYPDPWGDDWREKCSENFDFHFEEPPKKRQSNTKKKSELDRNDKIIENQQEEIRQLTMRVDRLYELIIETMIDNKNK